MTEIKPALTPEEWREHEVEGHYGLGKTSVYVDRERRMLFVRDIKNDIIVVACGASIGDRFCLGVAALCLHEHPQGFTHEDVQMARGLARYREVSVRERTMQLQYGDAEAINRARDAALSGDQGGFALSMKYRDWMESLAARIEALLPPSHD